jgi:hypothetical protein
MRQKIMHLGLAISLLIALQLAGCVGSSKPSRYYALDTSAPMKITAQYSVAVGPFELPEYLNRPYIVVRGKDERLDIADFDRWAEPLEANTVRRITSALGNQLDSAFVYEFLGTPGFTADYRVLGRISKFEADADNTVHLYLSWGISKDGELVHTPKNVGYTQTINSSQNMDEVTNAMGNLLDDLSTDMAAAIREIVAEQPSAEADD